MTSSPPRPHLVPVPGSTSRNDLVPGPLSFGGDEVVGTTSTTTNHLDLVPPTRDEVNHHQHDRQEHPMNEHHHQPAGTSAGDRSGSSSRGGALDVVRLRVLAEAARPGHAWYDADDLADALEPLGDIGDDASADGAFVAAASPAAILRLLGELDRLRGERGTS